MPSQKAIENPRLVAPCAACGKSVSTELLAGLTVGAGRQRRIVPVCEACRAKGWTPEQPPSDA